MMAWDDVYQMSLMLCTNADRPTEFAVTKGIFVNNCFECKVFIPVNDFPPSKFFLYICWIKNFWKYHILGEVWLPG